MLKSRLKIAAAATMAAAIFIMSGCGGPSTGNSGSSSGKASPVSSPSAANDTTTPKGAQILMKCYPEWITGYKDGKLVLKDGSTIVYDDGKKKSFVKKLDEADPEDMFAFKYDRTAKEPAYQEDAGRSRCEELFKKMYGASSEEVAAKLVTIDWFGQKLKFTTVNGADKALNEVAAELAKHPELAKYLRSEGTFYWRAVRGAKRQSAHSYGMTIDIGGDFKDYWQWSGKTTDEMAKVPYQNQMPLELVEIFEKHGFIWGGRWYHFDTMHFEYRPEILMANP